MDFVIHPALCDFPGNNDTVILINPSGRFVEGGFEADTGVTGRKLMVDTNAHGTSRCSGAVLELAVGTDGLCADAGHGVRVRRKGRRQWLNEV